MPLAIDLSLSVGPARRQIVPIEGSHMTDIGVLYCQAAEKEVDMPSLFDMEEDVAEVTGT